MAWRNGGKVLSSSLARRPRPAFSSGIRFERFCGYGSAFPRYRFSDGSSTPQFAAMFLQCALLHGCAAIFRPSAAAAASVLSDPWRIQKRFMGGAKKSMARARKNFAKRLKKQARVRELSKRQKIPTLDLNLRRQTRMRMMWNVKLILAARDGHVIPSTEFFQLSRDLGFPKSKLFTDFVGSFPGIFRITNDTQDRRIRWLEFSERAEMLVDEEEKIMKEYHEPLIVENLRKILMMAPARRVLISKLAHVRSSFWIPDNFQTSILPNYPQYFTITGAYLELAAYDKSLAVSARERKRVMLDDPSFQRRPDLKKKKDKTGEHGKYSFKISIEPHKVLEGNVIRRLLSFQQLPFPGPYDPIDDLDHRSLDAQKRVVGIFHEFLSLTVEKMAYVDHIAFFSNDYRLPGRLEDMLCRFPHIFYVSQKGDRHVVFLKEYYRNGRLVDRHPLFKIKEKFFKLMELKLLKQRSMEFRGICAESFIAAPREPRQGSRWSFPVTSTPEDAGKPLLEGGGQVEAATVVQDPGKVEDGEKAPCSSEESHRYRSSVLSKLGIYTDDDKSDEEETPTSKAPPPDSKLFLQLGFSDEEEDKSPRDVKVSSQPRARARGRRERSLGEKLGFLSDGEEKSGDEQRQVDDESWSWKALKPCPEEEQALERKKTRRVIRPFWEKKPFDNFNDPFF